jgi:hypothetical protein
MRYILQHGPRGWFAEGTLWVAGRTLGGMTDGMAFGHLGRSGLLVSRIGLGTMNFGFTADESASSAVMDTATSAAATSPPGTSPSRNQPPRPGTCSA